MSVRMGSESGLWHDDDTWDYNAAYTVMLWMRKNSTNGTAAFGMYGVSGGEENMIWSTTQARIVTSLSGGNGSHSPGFTPDVWSHYALVRSGPSEVTLYMDLAPVVQVTASAAGRDAMSGFDIGNVSGSHLVDVVYARCWTAALSVPELALEMGSATPVRVSGLWGNWALEVHTDATDSSGNGRDLDGYGTLSTQDNPTLPAPPEPGGGTLTPTIWVNKLALEVLTM